MSVEPFDSPQARAVLEAVCSMFKITEKALVSESKAPSLVYFRRVAWQATRELYPYVSTTEIGRLFRRDHTTVVQGLRWCARYKHALAADVARVKDAVQR